MPILGVIEGRYKNTASSIQSTLSVQHQATVLCLSTVSCVCGLLLWPKNMRVV